MVQVQHQYQQLTSSSVEELQQQTLMTHSLQVHLDLQQDQREHRLDSQHQQVVYLEALVQLHQAVIHLHQQLYQDLREQLTLEVTQVEHQVVNSEHQEEPLDQPLDQHLVQPQEELVEQLQQQVALVQVEQHREHREHQVALQQHLQWQVNLQKQQQHEKQQMHPAQQQQQVAIQPQQVQQQFLAHSLVQLVAQGEHRVAHQREPQDQMMVHEDSLTSQAQQQVAQVVHQHQGAHQHQVAHQHQQVVEQQVVYLDYLAQQQR